MAIDLVVLVVAFEPDHLAVAFERQDVGGDAVQEPAVMGDDHRAAREVHEGFFERAQGIDVEVVGRFVEEQDVAAALQELRKLQAIALAAGQIPDLLLLVGTTEAE